MRGFILLILTPITVFAQFCEVIINTELEEIYIETNGIYTAYRDGDIFEFSQIEHYYIVTENNCKENESYVTLSYDDQLLEVYGCCSYIGTPCATSLPVDFIRFFGNADNLEFTTSQSGDEIEYKVEYSTNGHNWQTLTVIPTDGAATGEYATATPQLTATTYFRVTAIHENGIEKISKVISLTPELSHRNGFDETYDMMGRKTKGLQSGVNIIVREGKGTAVYIP